MYLENIFVGSEDIRKQLPQESLMFDGVNQVFMQSMAQLHAVGNVIQATNAAGVLATFQVGCSGTINVLHYVSAVWARGHPQELYLLWSCVPQHTSADKACGINKHMWAANSQFSNLGPVAVSNYLLLEEQVITCV
jgi:hypothetical protein